MATKEELAAIASANPLSAGPVAGAYSAFGGKKRKTQMVGSTIQGIGSFSYDSNRKGSWETGAVNAVDAYLDQLDPTQLLERYRMLDEQSGGNIDDFLRRSVGVATAKDKAYYTAFKNAKDQIGRELTGNEFAQLAPVFYNPADFGSGISAGRQYLAQFAEREANSPQALARKATGYYGDVDAQIQQFLGRSASKEEQDYFGRMLASGQVSPYEVQQFIQQLPEYRQTQDKQFREGLNQELTDYDTKAFGRQKEDVLSRFAGNMDGSARSSALDFALTDLMGKIAEKRGQFLAGLSADQYGGNKALARQDYEGTLNRYLDDNSYRRQRQDQMFDTLNSRAFDAQDYAVQRRDYLDYLNRSQQKRRNPWGQIVGGGLGALIGSRGGPDGASAGYQIGSGLGGGYDYLNY